MAYQHTTLTTAENLLAGMLSDLQGNVSKTRWSSAELQANLFESLRFWSALTGMWRETTDPISVDAGTAWLDIPASTSLRAYTLYDRDLIGQIQYHFWEPYDPVDGTGMTEMWTFDEIVKALQRRRDMFLLETGCRLTRYVLPESPDLIQPESSSYDLPDTTIDVLRAAWVDPRSNRVRYMTRASDWMVRNSTGRLQIRSAEAPTSYIVGEAPISIEFNPMPANSGRLDLLLVEAGATLDPATGNGTLLGIPDDFAAAIKWGAMADLLAKDGPGRDYPRALFCERRYRMYVVAAQLFGHLIGASINGRSVQFNRIDQLDTGRPTWQSRSGRAEVLGWAGMNLLAIAYPPASACQLELDLVRNAPIPSSGSAYLQVGKEQLEIILGYAAHLSMFKIAGSEFAASTHLADNFFEAATEYNVRLAESAPFEELRFGKKSEQAAVRGLRRVTGNTVNEDQSGYK